jgi:hypothetical protein
MGYRGGKGNYDERDRLFQKSFDGKPVNRNEVKKNLDALFGGSGSKKEKENRCANGHSWVRDFNRKMICAYCRTPKPAEENPAGAGPA